ncbi:MAG: hypothetical protein GXP54_12225 [Deltaproteobacteria bacterium]|nr:hypothetical protein [Deltaproteobacteria bacterium]
MKRVFVPAAIAAMALASACGGGNIPVDAAQGDVVDSGGVDVVQGEVPDDTGTPDEGRDTATEKDVFDAGQCECDKAEECEPLFPDLGQCERAYCDPVTCKCVSGDAIDGTACDDGEACTDGDACKAGECVSGLNLCDCENDGDCAAYEDGNLCNGTLVCDLDAMPTVCKVDPATVIVCNDDLQLPCKTKECVPETGDCIVVNLDEGQACDDGNQCTENDVCTAGECAGEHTVVCDDGDLCTTDACVFGKGCVYTPIDCDDANECTVELDCIPATGCAHAPNDADPSCALKVTLESPQRAAALDGDAEITIEGKVASPAGPVTSLTVTFNGQTEDVEPSPSDGSFTLQVVSRQGLNSIAVDAEDAYGRTDHAARSYYYSTVWHAAGALVDDGLMGFLGPEALDDNDPTDLDDVATLLGALLKHFDPMTYFNNPLTTQSLGGCEFQVNVLAITFDDVSVDLTPQAGGVVIGLDATNVRAQVHAPATGPGCTDVDGWLVAPTMTVAGILNVSLEPGGEPVVSVTGTTVDIPTMTLEPDCAPYCGLVEPVRLLAQAMAVVKINDEVPGLVESALKESVEQTFDTSLLIPGGWPKVMLTADARFSTVEISDAGVVVGVAAGFSAPDMAGYPDPGSIGRADCLGSPQNLTFPNVGPVEIAVQDDLANQIPYAFHRYGAFKFPVTEAQVQAYGLDPSEFDITDLNLDVEALLPPIVTTELGRPVADRRFFHPGLDELPGQPRSGAGMGQRVRHDRLWSD